MGETDNKRWPKELTFWLACVSVRVKRPFLYIFRKSKWPKSYSFQVDIGK